MTDRQIDRQRECKPIVLSGFTVGGLIRTNLYHFTDSLQYLRCPRIFWIALVQTIAETSYVICLQNEEDSTPED